MLDDTNSAEISPVEGGVVLVYKTIGALRIGELRRCRTIDLSFGKCKVTSVQCARVVGKLTEGTDGQHMERT